LSISKQSEHFFATQLLDWFDQFGRTDLPWQYNKTPYRVWLSEIMLQQTQVKTVIPYYLRFMQRFPDIASLATAPEDDVLHLWTGLGYYARARNLHKTAQIIHQEYADHFPDTLEEVQSLPGIGRSTAGAILSFACGQHHPILDGNVKRILCRYYQLEGWSGHTQTQKTLWALAASITPEHRCDDFNQAMMDLGSSLCSRTRPQCHLCPLNSQCKACLNQLTHQYPNPKPQKDKPEKTAFLLMLTTPQGEVLLEKRPNSGIWGSLWSFPQCTSESEIDAWLQKHDYKQTDKRLLHPEFRHTFSHYHLHIKPVQILTQKPDKIMDTPSLIWYNLKKPLKLGMPAPITMLISNLANTNHA
jgi:A/G-specific adenine glycosylase